MTFFVRSYNRNHLRIIEILAVRSDNDLKYTFCAPVLIVECQDLFRYLLDIQFSVCFTLEHPTFPPLSVRPTGLEPAT